MRVWSQVRVSMQRTSNSNQLTEWEAKKYIHAFMQGGWGHAVRERVCWRLRMLYAGVAIHAEGLGWRPSYLLVKLDRTRATPLEGLEGVIPVEPLTTSIQIWTIAQPQGQQQCNVKQWQFQITVGTRTHIREGRTSPHWIPRVELPTNQPRLR